MIKPGDYLYCHTTLVFGDGQVCFTKGQSYEVIRINDDGEVCFINNQGEEHLMGNIHSDFIAKTIKEMNEADEFSYLTWFSNRIQKINELLDD